MPKMQNALRLSGDLEIRIYDVKDGQKKFIRRMRNHNQIVDSGRLAVMDLLCQWAAGTDFQKHPEWNQIWSLVAGTDPTPPTAGDTDVWMGVWTGVLDHAAECIILTAPTFEIFVDKTIPAPDAVGSSLCEAGLYTRGDNDDPSLITPGTRRLYARQTHPPILKTATMVIEYRWHLAFTVQT